MKIPEEANIVEIKELDIPAHYLLIEMKIEKQFLDLVKLEVEEGHTSILKCNNSYYIIFGEVNLIFTYYGGNKK